MDNLDDMDTMIKKHHNGKRMGGIIVVLVGAVLLCRQMGVVLPSWLFSWPMLLIVIGLFVGAKHQFRRSGWMVMCFIGAVFLMDNFIPDFTISQYFWPVFIIMAGLFMIFSKKKSWRSDWHRKWHEKHHQHMQQHFNAAAHSKEDYLDSVAIFGGIKRQMISKDFKGGDVVCIFSGAEINLTQAEIQGEVVLELVNVFAGTTLIVPANWEIKSELVAILGGIEDKRMQQAPIPDNKNVLVIRGTTVLGGIEIKSF